MTILLARPTRADGCDRRDWLGHAAARLAALGTGGLFVAPPAAAALRRDGAFLLGSPVELLTPPDAPGGAVQAVFDDLRAIHTRWNAWKPGELHILNAALRAGRTARPSPALRALIEAAGAIEARSLGFFNAGLGAWVGAWGFHADRLRDDAPAPRASTIERWRAAPPSLAQLEWRGDAVRSRNPALQLDFGGIAKGVALDRALDRLAAAGVAGALLNLGGNLAAYGGTAGRPWIVGIRDPFGPGLAATLETAGREAVVTSGGYERTRRADGVAVHHILDPLAARPAPGLASVTVVHPSATVADAAATALFAAGPARWRRVAERLGVDGVVAIDADARVHVTPRLARRVAVDARLAVVRAG
jgi:thiamine biosynthesis lipoprotein